MDDKFPRYASELVDMLVKNVPCPSVEGLGLAGYGGLDSAAVRRMAFLGGQHALVMALRAWRDEEDDADADSDSAAGTVHERVFGPDGQPRRDVASSHVAAETTPADPRGSGGDDDDDEPKH